MSDRPLSQFEDKVSPDSTGRTDGGRRFSSLTIKGRNSRLCRAICHTPRWPHHHQHAQRMNYDDKVGPTMAAPSSSCSTSTTTTSTSLSPSCFRSAWQRRGPQACERLRIASCPRQEVKVISLEIPQTCGHPGHVFSGHATSDPAGRLAW